MGSVYLICNNTNKKAYIGQTSRDVLTTRIMPHFNGYGGAKLLDRAIKKHGKENFSWKILCDGIIPELLDSFEIQAIKKYNTMSPNGYNLTPGGNGRKSGKKPQSFPTEFKSNLEKLIVEKGFSKSEFARKLGVTPSAVSRYISHKQPPGVDTMLNICKILEVSWEDLYNEFEFDELTE